MSGEVRSHVCTDISYAGCGLTYAGVLFAASFHVVILGEVFYNVSVVFASGLIVDRLCGGGI